MKKLIIFFIIMVSILTFSLTRSRKVDEENVVTEEEITQYKESLINDLDKYGYNLTEEEITKQVENYKQIEISIAKSKANGLEFGKALKMSLIISALCCGGLFLFVSLTKSHYREFFGMPYANSAELYNKKVSYDSFTRRREFFKKFFNK